MSGKWWSNNELKVLKELYGLFLVDEIDINKIAKILHRSAGSVYRKASELGLTSSKRDIDNIDWELYKKIKKVVKG